MPKGPWVWSRVGVSFYRVTERGRPQTPHTKVAWGAAPRPTPQRTRGLPPRNPFHSSAESASRCRPPLAMVASKMLPMEPVAAAALIRALSWQLRRVFITADSQYGTSLSIAWRYAVVGSRGSEELSPSARLLLRCSSQLTIWSWGRGSKGRISSTAFCKGGTFTVQNGSEFFNAAAAGRASCRGGPVGGCFCVPTTTS